MSNLSHLANDSYLDQNHLKPEDQEKFDEFHNYCMKNRYFNLGYPESFDFDYLGQKRFLGFHLNKCGVWNEYCNYALNSFLCGLNSFLCGKEVIEYFAGLYKIPFDKFWSHVTNGGMGGNM